MPGAESTDGAVSADWGRHIRWGQKEKGLVRRREWENVDGEISYE